MGSVLLALLAGRMASAQTQPAQATPPQSAPAVEDFKPAVLQSGRQAAYPQVNSGCVALRFRIVAPQAQSVKVPGVGRSDVDQRPGWRLGRHDTSPG